MSTYRITILALFTVALQISNSSSLEFSYTNCGPNDDPVKIKRLSLMPNPLQIPGNVTASADVSVDENITGPLTVILL